ncbi:MAG: NAD-dependent epimerase/dehydratase family protein [Nanoarchaeota archaeon]|nr:NAD-dependent epimerase/dehydratase family protein [Nanoarchaeota archaeon]
MNKVLVTGGAGFIGSHLVDALINHGYKVGIIDNLSTGLKTNLNPRAEFFERVDVRDKEKILEIFKKFLPEYVFHLAAQTRLRRSVENPVEDAQINIIGSLNVFNYAKEGGAKKIILFSSAGVYSSECNVPTAEIEEVKPFSPYGASKLAAEIYLRTSFFNSGLDSVILRPSNVYGPRQNSEGEAGVVAKFLGKEQPVIYGSGEHTRDYIYVKDVVSACLLAMQDDIKGIFNVGTGVETSANNLFQKICDIKGDMNVSRGPEVKEQARSALNSTKLRERGWKPEYSLEQGLRETVEWFRNH